MGFIIKYYWRGYMRKLFVMLLLIINLFGFSQTCFADLLYKVLPLNFDISSSLIYVPVKSKQNSLISNNVTVINSKEMNSITLKISSATTKSQPDDLFFSEGYLKELKINTNPDNTVEIVLYFKDNYNISNFKIEYFNNNIYLLPTSLQPYGMNYYINSYTEDSGITDDFKETLIISSKIFEKNTPVSDKKSNKNALSEINSAFINSNSNSNEVYSNYVITNETQNQILRSKFYVNNLTTNGNLFTLSGVGLVCFEKQFLLDNPKRMIFDIPNSILKPDLHNKELTLTNGDKIKIAQFSPTITRLVVTSKDAPQYIPVYFPNNQKILITSPRNLMSSDLPSIKTNITKTAFQKSNKLNNLIFEFNKPLTYSIKRTSDKLYVYFLNAEKFNESNFNNAIKSTIFNNSIIHTMKNSGLRLSVPMDNKRNLNTYISPEARVFKISCEEVKPTQPVINSDTDYQKIKKKEGTIIATPKFNNPKGSKVIVLDAGHGGKDCGCTRDGIFEKDITLDVCDRLQTILRNKGFKVYMTRTNDTYISVEGRALFNQNINPAIFVSVHVNSCNDESPKGIETHYYTDESLMLGTCVNKALTKKISYTTNRGLLRSRFYVINHTIAPAILVEIGFISNPDERKSLISSQRKQQTAEGIADGIIEYFNSTKK